MADKAKKDKTKNATLERKPDGTLTFKLTIPKDKVSLAYQKAIDEANETVEIKGFRKGKAPAKMVEEQVGKKNLYTDALKMILPEEYAKAVKRLQLAPITSPRVEPESLEEGHDWHLAVTVAEKPPIDLGDYKKAAAGALASSKIWVPGKQEGQSEAAGPGQGEKGGQQQSTDEKMAKIFDALLTSVKLTIPEFLLEEEINRLLAGLIQQLERLNLTIEQYVASLGKTADQLRKEYREQAERNLKLELILNEIAQKEEVKVQEEEINKLIESVGDEKLRAGLDTPYERSGIRASLKKRKVIDFLMKL